MILDSKYITKICGTCCYHQPDEDGEWKCRCDRSDFYMDWTSYDFSCPDYEDRDERICN